LTIPGPAEARRQFGLELQALRRRSGLTGEAIASRLGWSQPKISKIENGRQLPTVADVRAFAKSAGADANEIDDLVSRFEEVAIEVTGWRTLLRSGIVGSQQDLAVIEQNAKVVRRLEPSIVPGLLQTAEYARVMLTGGPDPSADVAHGIEARLRRQERLYAQDQKFSYVILEDALRRVVAAPDVLAVQMDRIIQLSTLSAVEVALIPSDSVLPIAPIHGFTIFDEELVQIELETGAVSISAIADVQYYGHIYNTLEEVSEHGDAARLRLGSLAGHFRDLAEQADLGAGQSAAGS
jgi:transcriptional regulator with XRE-family HTH domain